MGDKIPKNVLEAIESEISSSVTVSRNPRDPGKSIKISRNQRSEDSERREENMIILDELKQELEWGNGGSDWPVEVIGVGEVETRYSEVFIRVRINW